MEIMTFPGQTAGFKDHSEARRDSVSPGVQFAPGDNVIASIRQWIQRGAAGLHVRSPTRQCIARPSPVLSLWYAPHYIYPNTAVEHLWSVGIMRVSYTTHATILSVRSSPRIVNRGSAIGDSARSPTRPRICTHQGCSLPRFFHAGLNSRMWRL